MKILFVCLGNICRSPMAETIMLRYIQDQNLQDKIQVDSAGTYGGHAGELPDPRMRSAATKRGYQMTQRSRKFRIEDFDQFDRILVMDDNNYYDVKNLATNSEAEEKIEKMAHFCKDFNVTYIPDPYYEGAQGFEYVIDLLENGCKQLLKSIKQ